MSAKGLGVLFVVAAFTLAFAGIISAQQQEIKGTVSKIEGIKVTIQDDQGKETTVQVQDQDSLKTIRLGDKILVKGGKVTKEGT